MFYILTSYLASTPRRVIKIYIKKPRYTNYFDIFYIKKFKV